MTRFGEILPIWQKNYFVWQSFESLFIIWLNLTLFWPILNVIVPTFIVVSDQKLKK